MSQEIAKLLINIKSVKFSFDNHFTLTSGLKSPVYVDCRRIMSYVNERELNDICEECGEKHESVIHNSILTGFKVCKSCRISKTIFPL